MSLLIDETGIVKCAAKHERKPGDIRIGDALHYNLAMFFEYYDDETGTSKHQLNITHVDRQISEPQPE